MSGNAMWRGDAETHKARRAAWQAHELRRGAEGGEGRRMWNNVSGDAIWRGDEVIYEDTLTRR